MAYSVYIDNIKDFPDMKKEKNIQANYRLPESLLNDLKEVADATQVSQSQIVKEGVQDRVNRLKKNLERRQRSVAVPS